MQWFLFNFHSDGFSSDVRCNAIALKQLATLVMALVLFCMPQLVTLLLIKWRCAVVVCPANTLAGTWWLLSLLNRLCDRCQWSVSLELPCSACAHINFIRSACLWISTACRSFKWPSTSPLSPERRRNSCSGCPHGLFTCAGVYYWQIKCHGSFQVTLHYVRFRRTEKSLSRFYEFPDLTK